MSVSTGRGQGLDPKTKAHAQTRWTPGSSSARAFECVPEGHLGFVETIDLEVATGLPRRSQSARAGSSYS